jgi:peptidoglycan/LPS O-acetylase OafA/YrhL
MDALVLGGAAAVVARDRAALARVTPHLGRVMIAGATVLLLMWPVTRGFNRDDLFVQVIGYGVLSIFFVAFLLAVVCDPGSALGRAMSAPWLRWLGKYSYAIYVFHLTIAWGLRPWFEPRINGDSTGQAIVALVSFVVVVSALSLAAALISWNVLERWVLLLKDRWAPRTAQA